MSYIVEKSVNSMLHSLVGASVPNISHDKTKQSHSTSNYNISPGLVNFVEKLEIAAKISKQEEEDYVNNEYQHWLRKVSTQQVKISTIADVLCRGIIAYSRGHRGFNFHIHAIKLTQCDSIYEQKIGSLYLSRTLSPSADLTVLLVNSLQGHLNSGNYLQIACSLCLIPLITNTEVTSLLIQLVISCFKSQHNYIRKKAATMALVLCNSQYDKDILYSTFSSNLTSLIGDSEPSVVITCIISLSEIFKKSESLKDNLDVRNDLGNACAALMVQTLNKKLPESYNFNNSVAPMVLVQILRALHNIGHKKWNPSNDVEEALNSVLSQTVCDRSLSQCMSIIEAIHTTATISSNSNLISLCLLSAMRFIQSSNVDYKYVGIKALTQIFPKVKDLVEQKHVKAVMDCLYNCNPNLEKKSLKLLMAMVGPQNYKELCIAVLEYCTKMNDKQTKIEVYEFLCTVVTNFDVEPQWCLQMLPLIIVSNVDPMRLINYMLQIISKGIMLSKESLSLMSECQDTIKSLLSSDNIEVKSLRVSASLLSIQIKVDASKVPAELYNFFYKQLILSNDFTSYDEEIINCLVLCGVYETSLLSQTEKILNKYLEKVNFLLTFKIRESLAILKDSSSKKLFDRQTSILRHGSIDLTISFTDKFINKSHKQDTPYCPSDLLNQMKRRNEEQSILSLTDSSINSSLPTDSIKLTPVSSVVDVSVIGSIKSESPKLVWTKDGRKAVETTFEVPTADVSLIIDEDSQSVEIADEAGEELEIDKESVDRRKLDLMSIFLKGLKLSD